MANLLEGLSETRKWRLMVAAAKRGAQEFGYEMKRRPGRGLSNIFDLKKGVTDTSGCIRTTRDRWFAFPPLAGGTKWKTLDEVEVVIVSAVNSKENPERVEVYVFPAVEVRRRFDAAFSARAKDGQVNRDNFGMWVALDEDDRGIAASVGSGIARRFPPVATYEISDLLTEDGAFEDEGNEPDEELSARNDPTSIPEVMSWTRAQIARLAGVSVEAVRLDLKIEY